MNVYLVYWLWRVRRWTLDCRLFEWQVIGRTYLIVKLDTIYWELLKVIIGS